MGFWGFLEIFVLILIIVFLDLPYFAAFMFLW